MVATYPPSVSHLLGDGGRGRNAAIALLTRTRQPRAHRLALQLALSLRGREDVAGRHRTSSRKAVMEWVNKPFN